MTTARDRSREVREAFAGRLTAELGRVVVGQQAMVERLLIGLLTRGHLLIEGVPGIAKTLLAKSLAESVRADFSRVQFTPDLLPADLIGTLIYHQQDGTFVPRKGPVFTNFLLADEINRAPAKVQSALLEAMQERQVTIGDETFPLEEPFVVLATQNPIEQEGTYPLPEAQVDRFMMKLQMGFPSVAEERLILERMANFAVPRVSPVLGPGEIAAARDLWKPSMWTGVSATTSSRWSRRPAIRRRSGWTPGRWWSTAPRRGRASTSTAPPAPEPSSKAATSPPPRM